MTNNYLSPLSYLNLHINILGDISDIIILKGTYYTVPVYSELKEIVVSINSIIK